MKGISSARRQLLADLEAIIGRECYNASIQNYGPGGVREAAGRSFRYPITLRLPDGERRKVRAGTVPSSFATDTVMSGYYAFGANQLDIIVAIDKVVSYLERHHGLVVDEL